MNRVLQAAAFAAFTAMALSAGACMADEDDLKSLVAQCGGSNVKTDDIDSCLERARELGEESPSPQLQSLTAKLERLAERTDNDNDLSKTYMVSPAPEQSAGGGIPAAAPSAMAPAPHGNMH